MVLTVKQVANRLNCCIDTVYAHIYAGTLHAINISRKPGVTRPAWRVSEKALERFIAEQESQR
jgi:excisionase family DNA binding protein